MCHSTSHHVFIIFILLIIQIQHPTARAQQYRLHLCSLDNYTSNGTFQKNLNLLLPSLSLAGNSTIKNGYYNATIGRNLDTVYGSFQCRGDVPLDVCQNCVKVGTKEIKEDYRCPNARRAIIWYDICMVTYSNNSYFGIRRDRPDIYLHNAKNITNPDKFRPILSYFMNRLLREVESSNGSTKFAFGKTAFTDSVNIYGYVQCTEDISSSDCNQGLNLTISELLNLTEASQGGQILKPSLIVRFEIYDLFPSISTSSPPPLSSPAPVTLISPPSSTSTTTQDANDNKSSILVVSIVVPAVIAALCAISIWFFCFRKKQKRRTDIFDDVDEEIQSVESLQFNFSTISAATNTFSEANKLGEGGFGPVYKGTLSNQQHIAVKRLSENSGQGDQEFKNEVTLVAKLQHRNLVKLVGFSLVGEEKLLIYEFMPNASLDKFIFDPIKCAQLNWERRYKIIKGVATGLVYLHEESRLKIVHRDLKASNILLDKDMNPKIADFGMARLFLLDQTQASTKRIVGTHGYMAPEYVMHGKFSVKSDVFSFGVLVLEILTGRRNNSFHKSEIARDLLSYCTADISSSNCNLCLLGVISELPNCCDGKSGGGVIRPSCNFRYELYPFLGYIDTPSPPLSSSPAPLLSPPPPVATFLPPPSTAPNSNGKNSPILAICIAVPSVIVILSATAFWFFCFQAKKRKTEYIDGFNDEMQSTESLHFNYSTVSAATDNFAEANKLGEGGFGSVYKGTLSDSQEIAVKRLSRTSRQGGQEFKNEVTLVAKLQHRNLVKLIGFSLTGEEKLLIYEIMPNGSLDKFLFDPDKCTQLDWEKRYRIIGGVARGLLYLHEDGYMAPEYIMHGEFSIKSDVFSFGVLVLEILCGERNSDFHKTDVAWNLLSYAWKHWKNGSAIEILDTTMKDTCCTNEAVRCIHVALLCVQENVADRPSMPTVVQMLNNYSEVIPDLPSAPAFLADSTRHIKPHPTIYLGNREEQGFSKNGTNSESATCSVNEVSVTEVCPR
ncbi:hypothetical protein C5167_029922 [Papaver somniferum]|nr:hypothetical protein C5167_029922 [Papaver somniferum]